MSSPAANEERATAAEAAPAAASVKRQKTNSDDSPSTDGPSLNDLPETTVASIAEYLPDLSRALFSIAITAPSSRWRERGWTGELSDLGKMILPAETSTSHWKTIDLRKDWRMQWLTDDDLGALLVVVDGARSVEKLFLRQTYNDCTMIGRGLEPIRGSSALRQIDVDGPNFSEEIVLPVLQGIVESEGGSLVHVQLPEHWRKEQSSSLKSFLREFNEVLYKRKIWCSDGLCGNQCGRTRHGEARISFFKQSGLQVLTCYDCLGSYCGCCRMIDGPPLFPRHCDNCDRYYCERCADVGRCRAKGCKTRFCSVCKEDEGQDEKCSMCCERGSERRAYCLCCHDEHMYTCSYCERVLCDRCSKPVYCTNVDFPRDDLPDCEKVACQECSGDWEFEGSLKKCSDCEFAWCEDCLLTDYEKEVEKGSYEGFRRCKGCMALLFPHVEEQNAKLAKENEELKSKLASLQA